MAVAALVKVEHDVVVASFFDKPLHAGISDLEGLRQILDPQVQAADALSAICRLQGREAGPSAT